MERSLTDRLAEALERLEAENQTLREKLQGKGKPPTVRLEVESFIKSSLAHNPKAPGMDTTLRILAKHFTTKQKDEEHAAWLLRVNAQVANWKR